MCTGVAVILVLAVSVPANNSLVDCFQGNCEDVDAVAALGLEPDLAADLLPLKPHQCMLIIHESLLLVPGGSIWLDNLYLKLTRQALATALSFITGTGGIFDSAALPVGTPVRVFATNLTFHSSYGRDATAVDSGVGDFLTLFDGAPHSWCRDYSIRQRRTVSLLPERLRADTVFCSVPSTVTLR